MEVPVMQDILGKNDRIAAENQALFADKKIFVLFYNAYKTIRSLLD